MKIVSNRFAILCAAFGFAFFFNFSAQAQMTTINDATGEAGGGPNSISTAGGTLDIVKMEVGDTATDVVFRLTVNGNTSSPDWGKFTIGIANGKDGGTGGRKSGNGWNRPINLDAGTIGGMTHWIGSWVDGGNGAEIFTYNGTGWAKTAATYSGNFPGFSVVAGAKSVITFTVPKTSLGVVNGDTIKFDAYSSSGGGSDSAVDALANPNTSITSWGQTYTSSGANLASYTLANTLANATTQEITFSVNMSHQILLGTFNPATDAVTVDWGDFTNFKALTAAGNGVYTGTATIQAPQGLTVPYRFTIEPVEPAPLVSETLSRSFSMPNAATTISPLYFNNIEGYRDVTFSVNMSVQTALGYFNPATDTVEVRGPFSSWVGTQLVDQGGGIYRGTARVSGAAGPISYKFFTAGVRAGGYESGGDRSFNLALNSDQAPTPDQVLDVVFFSGVNSVPDFRPVTFEVNMNRQIELGSFVAGTNTLEIRGGMNSWEGGAYWRLTDSDSDGIYTGTFSITGAANSSVEYKFHTSNWENVPNRSIMLGPVQQGQTAPTVFFNNDSGATRQVTFAVDMSIQQAMGKFDPATGVVQLRGTGDFNATDKVPSREGDTSIFKGTFAVAGDAGTSVTYKFFSTGVTESGFEIINPNDLYENRSLTLLADGTPMVLDSVYFSNQSVVSPSGLSYTPSSASGTVGTPISSLTPTVTGTVASYSVSPTLPAGLSISTSTGVISGTPTAVSALDTYTVTAANGTGSTTATVTIEVVAAPNPLAAYVGSFGLSGGDAAGDADPDGDGQNNSAEYAFGTDPKSSASRPITLISSTGEIKLVYLQRNTGVSYSVKSFTDLATSFDSGTTVTPVATSPQPADVRTGYTQYEAALSTAGIPKGFLRVQATLAP